MNLVNYQLRILPRDFILVLMLNVLKRICVTGMPVHFDLEQVLKLGLVWTILKQVSVLIVLLPLLYQVIDLVLDSEVVSHMCVPILFVDVFSCLIELLWFSAYI